MAQKKTASWNCSWIESFATGLLFHRTFDRMGHKIAFGTRFKKARSYVARKVHLFSEGGSGFDSCWLLR
jgi:hypothetical protein